MIDHYENAYETIDKLREEVTDAEDLEADLIKRIRELEKALQNAVKALEEVEGTDDYYREEFRERVIKIMGIEVDKFKKDRIWIDKVLNRAKSILWEAIPVPEEEKRSTASNRDRFKN